jgi:hypothetical protein
MSSFSGNDVAVEGGVTGNITPGLREYRAFDPSSFLYSLKHPRRPEVPKSLSTPGSMVELYPPLDLTVEIYPHLTHGLDLTRGGVPHLTHDQSHDATWNYPGTPHHHGICMGPSNQSWTLQQGNFDTSVFNTPPISSNLPEPRSPEVSKFSEFLAMYFGLRPSGWFHPLNLISPKVRLH